MHRLATSFIRVTGRTIVILVDDTRVLDGPILNDRRSHRPEQQRNAEEDAERACAPFDRARPP
jgi:hypothetical protein